MDKMYSEEYLQINNTYTITLTQEERNRIEHILETLPYVESSCIDDDNWLTHVSLVSQQLPIRLARLLIHFRKNSNLYGTLLFRNMPIDGVIPSTPVDGRPSNLKTTMVSEYTLLLAMIYLGEPIAYRDEKEGALIQDICPIKGHEQKQENIGSVFLEFHTEDGFHPFKPDFVGLVCLRSDYDRIAKTVTASITAALPLLSDETLTALKKPLYRIRIASSFMPGKENFIYSPLLPVLSGNPLKPEICVDFHAIESTDHAGTKALKLLKSALEEKIIEAVLLPGDLIIIDNRVAVHARTNFRPRYDGQDRWLQRLFVVQDFRRSLVVRPLNSHVCLPLSDQF